MRATGYRGTDDSWRRRCARPFAGRARWPSWDLAWDAERLHGDTLRVEHPEQVVVRCDQQSGRLGKGPILRQERRIDVAMRADQGQTTHLFIEGAGGPAHGRLGVEETIRMEGKGGSG